MKVKQLIKSISSAHTHTQKDTHTYKPRQTRSFAALQMHRTLGGNIQSRQNASSAPLIRLGWLPVFFYFFHVSSQSPLDSYSRTALGVAVFLRRQPQHKNAVECKDCVVARRAANSAASRPAAMLQLRSTQPRNALPSHRLRYTSPTSPRPLIHCSCHGLHAFPLQSQSQSHSKSRRRCSLKKSARKIRVSVASVCVCLADCECASVCVYVCLCVCMTPSSQVLVEFSL